MTEQAKRIKESVDFVKANTPFKTKVDMAVITYHNPSFLKEFKVLKSIPYKKIPPEFDGAHPATEGELLFATIGKKNVYVLNGHLNFYLGYKMHDAAHPVYMLKSLGVNEVLIIDEVGHLNPRYQAGRPALIYDHINFMGDNPLIGENDNSIGPRFPDMSNPYDEKLYNKVEKFLIENRFNYYPSVYFGVTGPETETEAECRFYRETGADVLGYSLIPENLAVVHAGMSCVAFGMISRELVADRLVEINESIKQKNRVTAEKSFGPLIEGLVSLF